MSELTPMLKQYKDIKSRHPNELLFFRLGDFYELFEEDARIASKILNIVLTARHKGSPNEVPMCGIPYHALDNYLNKLLKAGKRVAICDQLSDPTLPGIVKRDVTRVITPGTALEGAVLNDKKNNFIVSLFLQKNVWGMAVADLTTGDFQAVEISDFSLLKNELFRLDVSEAIVAPDLLNDTRYSEFVTSLNNVNPFQLSVFDRAYDILIQHFHQKNLQSFGLEELKVGIEAAGRLLSYLKGTQKTDLKHITKISRYNFTEFMTLDEATIRNLELFQTAFTGEYNGSLLSVIDRTTTNMGGRALRRALILPFVEKSAIEARLGAVAEIKADHVFIKNITDSLKQIADLERLLGRIGCNRTNARDLVGLKNSLELLPSIKALLVDKKSTLIQELDKKLVVQTELLKLLNEVLVEDPPLAILEGGMVRDGYNHELDELRQISRGGKQWLLDFEAKEVERSGISSLKVRFNSIFGYYIEISKANLAQVPVDYTRRQTLVNAERFITPELKEYEDKILGAEEKINRIEYQIFLETIEKVTKYFSGIQEISAALAELDLLVSFATVANEYNYCQPKINENGNIGIANGRHPVIERFISDRYVPNDLLMDHEKNEFILLTGPNMSGKSSFLRQTALICLLAQMGSFVPAESAELGLVDRIFTRVGASDNLTQGVSTFMAEMQEAANILNNATSLSLIILDELGRGTSTYDGVSIAWAISEYIHEKIKAKTIFATHYHELTEIIGKLPRAENYCVAVSEDNGKVVFLHKIIKGASSRSYGIEVGRLAGLPDEIISRATEILENLESKTELKPAPKSAQSTLPLKISAAQKKVVETIKDLDVDQLTPLQALQKIAEMRNELSKKDNLFVNKNKDEARSAESGCAPAQKSPPNGRG